MTVKNIAIIGFDQANALDITGPMEVFASANTVESATERYCVGLYSFDGKAFKASSGMTIVPEGSIDSIPTDCETLILAGGDGVQAFSPESDLIIWLQANAVHFKRIVSVCSGAFLLAFAGLLENKKATTHWMACQFLKDMYPTTDVDENAIYTRDGHIYTSAGVTTGIDLCLALVEEDYGHATAMAIAKLLVLYLHRSGGQRQFSQLLKAQLKSGGEFEEIIFWIDENLDKDIHLENLAEQACLSPRQFSRRFQQAFGDSVMHFVAMRRLEKSRVMLEENSKSIKEIAAICGYLSVETLRRQFVKHFGISPQQYQQRFMRSQGGMI